MKMNTWTERAYRYTYTHTRRLTDVGYYNILYWWLMLPRVAQQHDEPLISSNSLNFVQSCKHKLCPLQINDKWNIVKSDQHLINHLISSLFCNGNFVFTFELSPVTGYCLLPITKIIFSHSSPIWRLSICAC